MEARRVATAIRAPFLTPTIAQCHPPGTAGWACGPNPDQHLRDGHVPFDPRCWPCLARISEDKLPLTTLDNESTNDQTRPDVVALLRKDLTE